jgi:fibronectin-binding autotransporter adhesin
MLLPFSSLSRALSVYTVLSLLVLFFVPRVEAQTSFNWIGTDSGSWADTNNWWVGGIPATILPGESSSDAPDRVLYGNLETVSGGNVAANPALANTVTNGFQTLDQDFTNAGIESIWLEGATNPVIINAGAAPHQLDITPGEFGSGNSLQVEGNSSLTFDTNVTVQFEANSGWYVAGGPAVYVKGILDVNGLTWSATVDTANVYVSGVITNSSSSGAFNFQPFMYNGAQFVVSGQIVGGLGGMTWYQPVSGAGGITVTNHGSIVPPEGASPNDWTWGSGTMTMVDDAIVGTGTTDDSVGGNIYVGGYGSYTVSIANNAQLLLGYGSLILQNTGVVNQNGGRVGNDIAGDVETHNSSIYNFNGGLVSNSVGLTAYDTSTFNFNGGTLDLGANGTISTNSGATTASFIVQTGGVVLSLNTNDTYNFNAPLQHGADTTADGGFLAASGGPVYFNAPNTYNGPTVITNGTALILGDPNALQNSTLIDTVTGGGAVQFANATAFTFGGLSGDNNISLLNTGSTPINLIVGNNGGSTIYGGALTDGGAGGSLVKIGSGTLTLTGASTYDGGTVVSNGVLSLTTSSTGGGAYTIAGGALEVAVAGGGASLILPSLTVNAGTSLDLNAGSFANPTAPIIKVTGALTPAAVVTINLTGTALTTGSIPLIGYGSLGGAGFGAFTPHLQLPLGFGGTATLVNDTAHQTIDVDITVTSVVNVPTSLGISQQPSANAMAGVPFATQPVITVLDQFGNRLASATNVITVTVAGGGNLNGSATPVTATAVNGVAAFSGLSDTIAGNIALAFSSGSLPPTNSENISVSANSLSKLIWSTQPGLATNGLVLGQSPVLRTADAYGNLTTAGLPADKVVEVFLYSGNGTVTGSVTGDIGTNAGNGTLTFANLAVSGSGLNQLIASDIGSTANPTNILEGTNCQLWLDANDANTLSLNGDIVTAWADKSGMTNNATGGTLPVFATNSTLVQGALGQGKVVRFNGSGGLNINLSSLLDSPYTIMMVEVAQAKSSSSFIIGNSYGGVDGTLACGYENTSQWRWQQYADDLNYNATFVFPQPRVWTEVMNDSLGETLYLGPTIASTRTADSFLVGTTLNQGNVGGSYLGDLAEIIVYNTDLNGTDTTNLQSYLTSKWTGLSGAISASFNVVSTNGPSGGIPSITAVAYSSSSSSISFSGVGGSANVSYRILTSTNLAAPLGTWVPVLTNSFNGSGAFSSSVPVKYATPDGFFILVTP